MTDELDPVEPEPEPELELYTECVVGWRAWDVPARLLPGQTTNVLMNSPSYSHFAWKPYEAALAECHRDHESPAVNCTCDLYAANSKAMLLRLSHPRYDIENGVATVIGEVNLFGTVVLATKGFKAQKAYPRRLWVPYECWRLCKPLSNTYGVPVGLDNWLSRKD